MVNIFFLLSFGVCIIISEEQEINKQNSSLFNDEEQSKFLISMNYLWTQVLIMQMQYQSFKPTLSDFLKNEPKK